ncbi:DUF7344 domain-containing protein [Halobaculum limi]|uniref:DUF7344 domain-containing protein n=1 Tax=Halobaculum limi TaxID=3031916 RepID=UPI002404E851|nr:hypothetical protein [Halobaculum sp. YSMS11]
MSEAKRPSNGGESLTQLLAALAESQCRRVVSHFLHDDDGRATLEEVAAAVAAMEPRLDESTVAVTLHHTTLPKLAAVGVVTYDPESRWVRYEGETLDDDAHALVVEAATLESARGNSPVGA